MKLFKRKNKSKENPYLLALSEKISNTLWIDGKDMIHYNIKKETLKMGELSYTIEYSHHEEPSIIYPDLPIKECNNPLPLSYYPSYKELSPCQRYTYLNWLTNTSQNIDVGYVFIYYYGLERQLLHSKFENAINIIDELRKVHENSSFLHYSSEAIIYSCFYHNRIDFFQSLEVKLSFSELFAFAKLLLTGKFYGEDIINSASYVGFKNRKYIKEYPDLFMDELLKYVNTENGSNYILIEESQIKESPIEKVNVFANISFDENSRSVAIYKVFKNEKIKYRLYEILKNTHENVKITLKEMRKNNTVPQKKVIKKDIKKIIDPRVYKLNENQIVEQIDNSKDDISLHFAYMNASNFYYSNRDIEGNIQKAELYATYDIQLFPNLKKLLMAEFNSIPSLPMFNRLAIIYEKSNRIEKAFEICNLAINIVNELECEKYRNKIQKLRKKMPNKQIE